MRTLLLFCFAALMSIAGVAQAQVNQDSIDACIDQLRTMPDQSGGTILSTEFSEANSLVMLEDANGAVWRCLVSNDGVVAELNVSQPAPAEQPDPAPAQVKDASVNQDAIDACIDRLRTMPGQSGGTILSTEFSEANSLVMLEDANGAVWRCLVSNDAVVAELSVSQPAPAPADPAPALAQVIDADVSQDAIDACIDQLRTMPGQSGGTVLSTEFSEANSVVMLEDANGAQWRCLVSNNGQMASLEISQPAPQATPAPAQVIDSSVNQDSIDACIDRLRSMPGQSGGTILSTEFSEANSVVMLEDVNGAVWRCLVSNSGVVAELNVSQPAPAGAPAPARRAPDYADGMSGGPDFWRIDVNSRLRVHTSPSLASPVVGRIPRDAVVRNLGCRASEGRTWCQIPIGINDGASIGWASSEFLVEAAGPARMPAAPARTRAPAQPAPDYADGMSGGPDFWEVDVHSSLRVHAAPSTGSPTFFRLPTGSVVRNLGCRFADGRRWCQVPTGVDDGASIGWVAGEFLKESAGPARIPAAAQTRAPAPKSTSPAYAPTLRKDGPAYWQVNVHGNLKVHAQPSTASAVLDRLHRGMVVRNLGCQYSEGRTWCHVPTGPYDGDAIGWVAADYLVPGAAPSRRVDHHATRTKPTTRTLRMRFASGSYGGDHADTLLPGSSVRYVFGAANRQTLEISFHKSDPSIEYQIILPNGRVLLDPISSRLPYQGELFMGGDHVLEVINRGNTTADFDVYMGIY
ncbi:SH3 domain-containing protein [uncultured Mameliella sp.]|uniref:SH3 domain-containing protein n=1 Tax=uncultured Mameliella sp. TaxID=1447087 RepID=UPI002601F64F|nr:SH3 domain-containing protein [uncultured Mameliella sp.]